MRGWVRGVYLIIILITQGQADDTENEEIRELFKETEENNFDLTRGKEFKISEAENDIENSEESHLRSGFPGNNEGLQYTPLLYKPVYQDPHSPKNAAVNSYIFSESSSAPGLRPESYNYSPFPITISDEALKRNIYTSNAYPYEGIPSNAIKPLNKYSNQHNQNEGGDSLVTIAPHNIFNGYPGSQKAGLTFEDAKSRAIAPAEYIFPTKLPGGEASIQCNTENEFHHFWSHGLKCLVCICLNEYGSLTPVCASCAACESAKKPGEDIFPMPSPIPVPNVIHPYSPEVPLQPLPEPQVITVPPAPPKATCSPLPTLRPFTNPLHPCQICICKEVVNYIGKVDVQIQCQENPQCVIPSDLAPLPIIPDTPIPTPLPMCEKFPPNVFFPHPKDVCKLCKCTPEFTPTGTKQLLISCFTNADCGKPETFQPVTEAPMPEPTWSPLPDVTAEPLPWPHSPTITPITTPRPIPPSSTTCSPLPTLKPFTNPLHPCQICICKEVMNYLGIVDVQINCHDNPQCVIPPDLQSLPTIPDTPVPTPLPMCEKFPPNVSFPHPHDGCKLCKCSPEITQTGTKELLISCHSNPDCGNTESPPLPDSTAKPLPWPPVSTISPLIPFSKRPGPLPGPSPHESCRPYPPNQPFQHPWDECQICQCYESSYKGRIEVEINCQTNPSCCIEPSLLPTADASGIAGSSNSLDVQSLNNIDTELATAVSYKNQHTSGLGGVPIRQDHYGYKPRITNLVGEEINLEEQNFQRYPQPVISDLIQLNSLSNKPKENQDIYDYPRPTSQEIMAGYQGLNYRPNYIPYLNQGYGNNYPGLIPNQNVPQKQSIKYQYGYGNQFPNQPLAGVSGYESPGYNIPSYGSMYGLPGYDMNPYYPTVPQRYEMADYGTSVIQHPNLNSLTVQQGVTQTKSGAPDDHNDGGY